MLGDLGEGEGSVMMKLQHKEDNVRSLKLKVYPHLLHYLKAHGLNIKIPSTMRGMRSRLGQLQSLLMSLENIHDSLICGYRMEFVIEGRASIDECYELIYDHTMIDGVPEKVMLEKLVTIDECKKYKQ